MHMRLSLQLIFLFTFFHNHHPISQPTMNLIAVKLLIKSVDIPLNQSLILLAAYRVNSMPVSIKRVLASIDTAV